MSTISERFVQDAVAEQLNRRYYRRKPVYAGTETYTKLKRADVLLAFMRAPKRPYTVVVEAKSRTTIGNLKLKAQPHKELWWSRTIAATLIVVLMLVTGYEWYVNAMNAMLLLAAFIAGVALIGWLVRVADLRFTKSISAIEQLAGYPANESWIAIAEDTFAKTADYRELRLQCRKNGVGLIVVNRRGKLSFKAYPKPRHTFNDYLSKYGKKRTILAKIAGDGRYGPTPAERRQRRRQTAVALGGLVFAGAVGLLTYEKQYGPVVVDPIATGYVDLPLVFSDDTTATTIQIPRSLPTYTPQSCSELAVTERSFIVVDLFARSPEAAQKRVTELRDQGFETMQYISASCFTSWANEERFVVHANFIHPDRSSANQAARSYREKLSELGLSTSFGKPLKVKPLAALE